MFKRITIELTNFCNLECAPCPRHHSMMPLGEMSEALWERLLDQLSPGTTLIPFWRGEALLHHYAREFLMMAVARQLDVVLATNGHYLSCTIPPDLLAQLKAVSISLHGLKSYQAYLWLVQHAKLTGKPEIQLTVVDGEETGIPDAIFKAHNVRRYKEHTVDGVWGRIRDCSAIRQMWCDRLDTDLVITWDGKVSRCCYVWDPIPGLDANEKTLEEIWDSPQLMRIRKEYPDPVCFECDQWLGSGKTL